jgi:predicted AlkP superfamily phosphohydrolase/phosphomutase
MVDQVVRGDQVVHGPYASRGPDLHVVLDGYRAIAFPLFATDNKIVTQQIRSDTGCHRLHGVLMMAGPDVKRGHRVDDAGLMDLAPTILHLMDLPVPDDMDGRVLTDLLTTDREVTYEHVLAEQGAAETDLPADDAAEVEERLRALGYLG